MAFEIFLVVPPGLESVLADEAREAGFSVTGTIPGGVTLTGDWIDVWRANLVLRGATRVLARIGEFRAFHLAQLDKRARKMPWSQLAKYRKLRIIMTVLLLVLFLVPYANSQNQAAQNPDENARQKLLENEAAKALLRLKRSMERDGFYSGRIALNIWRSTALDAGTFDQTQYDEFKKKLYEKSVNDSLRCFEDFILEEDFYNANFCLQTWRIHSKELGTYEQAEYEALKEKLEEAKAAKASRKTEAK